MNKPTKNIRPAVVVEITDGYDSDKVMMHAEVADVPTARVWIAANAPSYTSRLLDAWWVNLVDGRQVVDFGSHRFFGRIKVGGDQ